MKSSIAKKILLAGILFLAIVIYFTRTHIENEIEVSNHLQGEWIGYGREAEIFKHYKLTIEKNKFKGWFEVTHTLDQPNFSNTPSLKGTYSFSNVQTFTNTTGKYRNIYFTEDGRSSNDNSISAIALTNEIVYSESDGLYIAKYGPMDKRNGYGKWQGWVLILCLCIAIYFELKERYFKKTENDNEIVNYISKESSQIDLNILYKAKELLDAGLISIEEFNIIKVENTKNPDRESITQPYKNNSNTPKKETKSLKAYSLLVLGFVVCILLIKLYILYNESNVSLSDSNFEKIPTKIEPEVEMEELEDQQTSSELASFKNSEYYSKNLLTDDIFLTSFETNMYSCGNGSNASCVIDLISFNFENNKVEGFYMTLNVSNEEDAIETIEKIEQNPTISKLSEIELNYSDSTISFNKDGKINQAKLDKDGNLQNLTEGISDNSLLYYNRGNNNNIYYWTKYIYNTLHPNSEKL